MRVLSITPESALPAQGILCHDVRNPAVRSEVLVRKGSIVTAEDLGGLFARGVQQAHLAISEPSDVGEDAAAERLARATAGAHVSVGEAHFGQASHVSSARGMLRVDAARLDRVNTHEGVLVVTAEPDRPVEVGTTLGVVKCAPMFLPEATLTAVENLATEAGPVLEIELFQARRVALVAPEERLRGSAFSAAQAALSHALAWYGSSLQYVERVEVTVEALAAAYQRVRDAGAELIMAAGASGTDPLDAVFEGLREAGGEVLQSGIPAEPGTACWIGSLRGVPVLGLASCELFGRPGALDLLLPQLLTGAPLDRRQVRRLALGGLLMGPSRIAPYHAGRTGGD